MSKFCIHNVTIQAKMYLNIFNNNVTLHGYSLDSIAQICLTCIKKQRFVIKQRLRTRNYETVRGEDILSNGSKNCFCYFHF